jgi:hypothetical protein
MGQARPGQACLSAHQLNKSNNTECLSISQTKTSMPRAAQGSVSNTVTIPPFKPLGSNQDRHIVAHESHHGEGIDQLPLTTSPHPHLLCDSDSSIQ